MISFRLTIYVYRRSWIRVEISKRSGGETNKHVGATSSMLRSRYATCSCEETLARGQRARAIISRGELRDVFVRYPRLRVTVRRNQPPRALSVTRGDRSRCEHKARLIYLPATRPTQISRLQRTCGLLLRSRTACKFDRVR